MKNLHDNVGHSSKPSKDRRLAAAMKPVTELLAEYTQYPQNVNRFPSGYLTGIVSIDVVALAATSDGVRQQIKTLSLN
jgi:hypothetical protein